MLNKFSTIALLGVALAGMTDEAHAAPQWKSGPAVGGAQAHCGTAPYAQVSYVTDPGISPKTGDVAYIRIVAQTSGQCTAVMSLEFRLPPGMVKADGRPVYCIRGAVGTPGAQFTNASDGSTCFQQPQGVAANGSLRFAQVYLGLNQYAEIQIPIHYTRRMPPQQLLGIVIPSVGPSLTPTVDIDVPYRPLFSQYAVELGTAYVYEGWLHQSRPAMTMSFRLEHFHEAAQVFVDYGTTTSLGSSTGPLATDAQYTFYGKFVMPQITGLSSGTTYYWRPRIVTPHGTFVGDIQSAMTNYELQDPSQPVYYPYPCRRGC